MNIRDAEIKDIPYIEKMLVQICTVHSQSRPDLFRNGGQKYTAKEIEDMINDSNRPVFVAYDENNDTTVGYAMCILSDVKNNSALCDLRSLYLDDLCVDENVRGQGIGSMLFSHIKKYAESNGIHNLTLNVWEGNDSAKKFYDKQNMTVQKTTLELIFDK